MLLFGFWLYVEKLHLVLVTKLNLIRHF